MTDREKVINDLQDAVNDDWMWQHADYYAKAMENAIALLKEQEAVEPIMTEQIVFGTNRKCSKCNRELFPAGRYCPHCGRLVKWDA